MGEVRFRDRTEAGRELAGRLEGYAGQEDVVVLGLPRGGIPVAAEVARALGAPLEVFLVRKLGVPGHEELAMGAIASGATLVLNEDVVAVLALTEDDVERAAAIATAELTRRERLYRGDRPPPALSGRVAILVDDGLATGATMRAAAGAVRRQGAGRVVVAVPVASRIACEHLRHEADEVVCVHTPEPFMAVGLWYDDFEQTSDEEVQDLLARSRAAAGSSSG